ncbi:hypothetical protein [Marinobacter sp.]|uniref:hypothetical protein n=1 Tax=Marinobacter sp. TaxID=50741 RepID=UPI003A8E0D84
MRDGKTHEQRTIDTCANRYQGAMAIYKPVFDYCVSKGWSHRRSFLMTLGVGVVVSGVFVWVCWAAITVAKS